MKAIATIQWGDSFLRHLLVLTLLCLGSHRSLLLIADGAGWIRDFFTQMLGRVPNKQMILDWYYLHKKSYDLTSMICKGRQAKAELLLQLHRHLWRGQVGAAVDLLQAFRPQAKNDSALLPPTH